MPNVAKVLKDEIQRLARKEIRSATRALRADVIAMKSAVRTLRNKIAESQKAVAARGAVSKVAAGAGAAGAGVVKGMRFNSKALKTMRARLGLSQREMARLIGVTSQAVYLWEAKGDKLRLRNETRQALLKLKGMGKREARRLVDAK